MTIRIGLTGGIGCGKSSAGEVFRYCGITVIDADTIAHQLYQPGSPILNEISQKYGHHLILANGELDRAGLREIVFSDPVQKQWLESLLHPAIRQRMHSLADVDKGPYCVLEIPLLLETRQQHRMDRVLVVHCPQDIRRERLIKNRGLSDNEIDKIMQSQVSDEARLREADDIVVNDRGLETLRNRIKQ